MGLAPQRTAARLLRAAVRGGPHRRTLSPPAHLQATARRVRRRLEILQAAPAGIKPRSVGTRSISMHGYASKAKPAAATSTATPPVYAHRQRTERSLATLLLADLSLSTDAYATSNARVIDVIREALYVLAQHCQARATLLRFWGSAPCADSMCASSTSRASMNLGATRYTPALAP